MQQSALSAVEEDARPRDAFKEIKVSIPASQVVKLQGIRLIMEQSPSETVQKALDHYLAGMREART